MKDDQRSVVKNSTDDKKSGKNTKKKNQTAKRVKLELDGMSSKVFNDRKVGKS